MRKSSNEEEIAQEGRQRDLEGEQSSEGDPSFCASIRTSCVAKIQFCWLFLLLLGFLVLCATEWRVAYQAETSDTKPKRIISTTRYFEHGAPRYKMPYYTLAVDIDFGTQFWWDEFKLSVAKHPEFAQDTNATRHPELVNITHKVAERVILDYLLNARDGAPTNLTALDNSFGMNDTDKKWIFSPLCTTGISSMEIVTKGVKTTMETWSVRWDKGDGIPSWFEAGGTQSWLIQMGHGSTERIEEEHTRLLANPSRYSAKYTVFLSIQFDVSDAFTTDQAPVCGFYIKWRDPYLRDQWTSLLPPFSFESNVQINFRPLARFFVTRDLEPYRKLKRGEDIENMIMNCGSLVQLPKPDFLETWGQQLTITSTEKIVDKVPKIYTQVSSSKTYHVDWIGLLVVPYSLVYEWESYPHFTYLEAFSAIGANFTIFSIAFFLVARYCTYARHGKDPTTGPPDYGILPMLDRVDKNYVELRQLALIEERLKSLEKYAPLTPDSQEGQPLIAGATNGPVGEQSENSNSLSLRNGATVGSVGPQSGRKTSSHQPKISQIRQPSIAPPKSNSNRTLYPVAEI